MFVGASWRIQLAIPKLLLNSSSDNRPEIRDCGASAPLKRRRALSKNGNSLNFIQFNSSAESSIPKRRRISEYAVESRTPMGNVGISDQAVSVKQKDITQKPLSAEAIQKLDAYWRAANYLSVGQIYLKDNPLLERPLSPEDIKPRLLGHWGTAPGLNFIYVHLNRLIVEHDLDMMYIIGPGHGGPGIVANTYLEGTYNELYPNITEDAEGLKRLFTQFSFPGGIPSHVAPETPGSIHEGGELGYSLSHAFGAVFDNPDLVAACVVGDGEAETGPAATG